MKYQDKLLQVSSIYNIYSSDMNPVLHHVLSELDKQSLEIDDYFKWKEDEKEKLVQFIGDCIKSVLPKDRSNKQFLIRSIWLVIEEAEEQEEYEQADILTRCLVNLMEGYW